MNLKRSGRPLSLFSCSCFYNFLMPALIEANDVKRKMYFEHENTPFYCMDVEEAPIDRMANICG